MKYINADEFAKVLWNSLKGYRKVQEICAVKGCILELEEQPAVDAVEVVRCKDCGHYNGKACVTLPCNPIVSRKPDDYCSYGRRRDVK